MSGSSSIKPTKDPLHKYTDPNTNSNKLVFFKKGTTTGNMMYGDIVIGMWWCIVVPIHGRDLWILEHDDPNLPGARIVYGALVVACGLCMASIFTGKMMYSRLAFLANIYAMSVTNLYEFPFPGECAITPMMVGGTFLGVLSNFSLEFSEKMLRLPIYFGAGSYVCIHSPYCYYEEDTRPILGGTVLLEMTLLVLHHYGGIRKVLSHLNCIEMNIAHIARMVLACLFLHHVGSTLNQLGGSLIQRDKFDPNHTLAEQFFIMVKAGVVACVGIAATGAFQEEISLKERAQRKAKEESMMAKAMADSMMVLTHELRTPLQGIMGATSMLLQDKEAAATAVGGVAETKKDSDDEIENESLKLIMASSGLLLNLINNMLDVKRVAEGMMEEFPLTLFPAVEPIHDAIGFCLPLASISNVSVQVDYGADTKMEHAAVRSNALRLQQVFINLISNAIKYTNNDGDTTSVIKVSMRSTTVEDVNWRMMRSLASSYTVTPSTIKTHRSTNKGEHQQQFNNDTWSVKDKTEKVILFGVSDCGPGIDQSQANRLFRRFGRLDDKPKRTLGANKVGQPSGTGLGLHLCQLFVQRMDGQIWATNNPDGQGATFCFCLPLGLDTNKTATKKSIKASTSSKQKLPLKTPSKRNWGIRFDRRRGHFEEKESGSNNNNRDDTGGKLGYDDDSRTQSTIPSLIDCDNSTQISILSSERQALIPVYHRNILIVDDTMINRKILNRMLKQIGFTKLFLVGSGEAALEEIHKNRYDLVITDLQMPGMDGCELSEAIHKINDGFFITPVVIGLTADSSQQTIEKCKASCMSDVIHKPITCDELRDFFVRRISVLIEQNKSAYLEP